MTLVVDRQASGPAVHVLAIGVGAYRHLPKGAEPVPHDTYGLGQLTGPPHSAIHFVEWIENHLRHPTVELGTIELLLSTRSRSDVPDRYADVDVPTMAEVTRAFDDWYARCDADPDNVAILYFCGHGVERGNQFLLLEDFGRVKHRMLENAVDIDSTFDGLASCRARRQYVFVDACREIPYDLARKLGSNAAILAEPEGVTDNRSDKALVKATSGPGQKAYGRPGMPTRFTRALVGGLDGRGAVLREGVWQVSISYLSAAINFILREDPDAPPQQPDYLGSSADALHQLPGPPEVPVRILSSPDGAARTASVALASYTDPTTCLTPTADGDTWLCLAPADTYRLTLDFPGADYVPLDDQVTAQPPGVDKLVQVVAA